MPALMASSSMASTRFSRKVLEPRAPEAMYRGSKRPLDLDEPLAGAEELEPGGADVEAGDSQALAVARLEVSTTLATIASCPRVRMLVLLSEPYRVGRLSITIASDRRKPTASITQRSLVNRTTGSCAKLHGRVSVGL